MAVYFGYRAFLRVDLFLDWVFCLVAVVIFSSWLAGLIASVAASLDGAMQSYYTLPLAYPTS